MILSGWDDGYLLSKAALQRGQLRRQGILEVISEETSVIQIYN